MARKINNGKENFCIIKLNREEAEHLEFGIGEGKCICSGCNLDCGEEIYYLPILDDTFCNDCIIRYINRGPCKEDKKFEQRMYNYFKEALGAFWEDSEEEVLGDD